MSIPQDQEMARAFIAALAGAADALVTFQTFNDSGESETPPRILHGTLDEHWDHLLDAQDAGHGVFVMVNEGDLKGRQKKNVTGLRALFADDDKLITPAKMRPGTSMVVLSGHGAHYYWLLGPGVSLDTFEPAQRGIAAKLCTDPAVHDLCRVLRLPGTLHLKDRSDPKLVELVSCKPGLRYSTAGEVLALLGASPRAQREPPVGSPPRPKAPASSGPPARAGTISGSKGAARKRAEAYVRTIEAIEGDGGDSKTFQVACKLLGGFPGLSEADAFEVFRQWNQTNAIPPWSEQELRAKFVNAAKYGSQGPIAPAAMPALPAPASPLVDCERYCFDLSRSGTPWRWWNGTAWGDGISETALNRLLANAGVGKDAQEAWKQRVPPVVEARPVYSSKDRLVEEEGVLVANTFRPPSLKPIVERYADNPSDCPVCGKGFFDTRCVGCGYDLNEAWEPIRRVLMNLANNDADGYRWLLGWFAKVIQGVHTGSPARIGTAPTLFGPKGSGKGTMEEVVKACVGRWNVASITQRELTSDFNSYLDGVLVVFANEVWSSERKGGQLLAKLKDALTCHERIVNRKGVAETTRTARENWVLSSNSHRPVEVEKGDRRLSLFRTGPAIPVELGQQVADDARADGPICRAFLAHVLSMPASELVSDYRPMENAAKREVELVSGNSATKFAQDVASRGFYSVAGSWVDSQGGSERSLYCATTAGLRHLEGSQGQPLILARTLMSVYRTWCADVNAPATQESTLLAALREEMPGLLVAEVLHDRRRERVITGLDGMSAPDRAAEFTAPELPIVAQQSLAIEVSP